MQVSSKKELLLTPNFFSVLLSELLDLLQKEYNINSSSLLDYQLYGFGNYEESLPSIKKLITLKTNIVVNGKYLYNKFREFRKGKRIIKFNREYSFVYFQTLGYLDIYDFIEKSTLNGDKKKEQLDLYKAELSTEKDTYYIGYYLGENGIVISTKLILSEAMAKAIWVLAYWELPDKQSTYVYNGDITYQENNMSLHFKSSESHMNRSAFIALSCDERVKIKHFLRGGYCGYDWNGNPVLGEIIFQRVESKEEQDEYLLSKKINPVIFQYISGKRWVIPSKLVYSVYDLSTKSKFAHHIENYINNYNVFYVSVFDGIHKMTLSIVNNLGNATLTIGGSSAYKGVFKVLQNGQLFIGKFKNINSNLPIYIFFNTSAIHKHTYTGNLLGVSNHHKYLCGKAYFFAGNNDKRSLSKVSKLRLKNTSEIPKLVLTDFNNALKNNPVKGFLTEISQAKNNYYYKYLIGDYNILFYNSEKQRAKALLKIKTNSEVELIYEHLYYKGIYSISEGAILSIYLSSCNDIPHCGHIMCKINRTSANKIYKGSWHCLDKDFYPQLIKVSIVNASIKTSEHNNIFKNLLT
ncbi:MAG: hypothetical protein ACK5H1_01660 [Tenacibaculum sp.]